MSRRSLQDAPLLDSAPLAHGPIADVAPLAPIDRRYAYLIPAALSDAAQPGVRVRVPFGRGGRPAEGIIVARSDGDWTASLQPLLEVLDPAPLLSPRLLELAGWIARYYACPLGVALSAVAPRASHREAGYRMVRYVLLDRPPADGIRRTAIQQRVLDCLRSAPPAPDDPAAPPRIDAASLRGVADCSTATLRAMTAKGWIRFVERREPSRPPTAAPLPREADWTLNADQQAAAGRIIAAMQADGFRALLLFGVTGSGKTEVYVHAIRAAIARGRQAILLVPEIALTTQTLDRLSRRFDRVAVLHSGVGEAQRTRDWAAIAAGRIDLVIGTRSALFAPCPRLGLIVVDEEQEGSYKNIAAPRYHTRDVAIKRAQIEGTPVLLGSATPALETWSNAAPGGRFELLRLPNRVSGLRTPRLSVVDLREEHRERRGVHLLSRAMESGLRGALARGEQSLLLLNRRGYANYLFCARCRTPVVCPHCGVYVVLHRSTGLAHCHYCRARLILPTRCAMAECGGTLVKFGMGTERVEEELKAMLPQARIARMDSDVMARAADYADLLGRFAVGGIDVLVGTQMIAKGLDFPRVTFVGVVNADTALAIDDFRSAERTFQLTLQVAGRAGRSEAGGEAVVQTFHAGISAIQFALRQDYEGFAAEELTARRRADLPPFARLVRIVLADPRLTRARDGADGMARAMREALFKAGLRGLIGDPRPAALPRLRDAYRFEALLTFATAADLLAAMDHLRAENLLRARCRSVIVDVDPVALQ